MVHAVRRFGRRTATLLALAASSAASGSAAKAQLGPQSTQADEGRANKGNWTLANRFSTAALRAITYTQAVQPRFLGQTDSMYYNWKDRNGNRFMLFVPSPTGGTKRLLFDPAKLAEQLTMLSKKPYDATNLPFQTITFLKSHKAFRFTVDTVRYEWTLATETLKSNGRVVRNVPPPADEELNTQGGGGPGGGGARGEFRNYNKDSSAFVFARMHNLYIVEKAKNDTVQISTDGVMDYSFGYRDTTENARQLAALAGGGQQTDGEQDDSDDASNRDQRIRPNVSWSPDGKSFSFVRRDQRKVKDLFLVNVLAQPRPVLLHYKYTMPGEEDVTRSELWTYRRGETAVKQINVAKWKDQSLMNVHWPVNGDKVRVVRRDRPQRAVDFIEVDVTTGAIKTLLTDAIEGAALEPKNIAYLKQGGDFLWWSQKTGWGMFYVYGFDGGEKRPLTTGQWNANSIVKIDSTTQQVWVSGQGREAGEQLYQTHLYRVNGDGTGFTLLDAGNAHHATTLGENGTPSVVSPTKRYIYDSFSRMDLPFKSVLRDGATGRILSTLEEMDLSKLKELGFKPAETFSVKAADGITELYGNMWKPFDFDSAKKYPIVAHVYPGPQTEGVNYTFSATGAPQQLAQLGFIVIQIGNRGGSPLRSLAYHRYGYYNLRDYALADKKVGIEQLAARHSFIDIEKVGIYGHSGGGFLTAAALMLPPYNDFFKVGVSSSGNHDNNIYNANWSENNHGLKFVPVKKDTTSRGRAGGIAANGNGNGNVALGGGAAPADTIGADSTFQIRVPTNIELAPNLKGRLLLTTGDMDNNVHPGNTVRMVNALIKANKRFDYMVFPGKLHGYGDMQPYFTRMIMEYFAEHLLGDNYRGDASIR
ncbi:DPP IV N-terminal domain-containing protein [Gemmatimonas sp.]|uniref:S9 family peptidase n=1 Tax=Gemmatimonas sp. TaxID=1962908 RepID=UPI00286DC334|nr:DPP IV N-terminal domain-containing protein [Gemmatimonas sp.]